MADVRELMRQHREGALEPGLYLVDDGDDESPAFWVEPAPDNPWPSSLRRIVFGFAERAEQLRRVAGDNVARRWVTAKLEAEIRLSDGGSAESALADQLEHLVDGWEPDDDRMAAA